ncbi:MAG: sensor histidine kinase [Acidimicrobiales bacterium]
MALPRLAGVLVLVVYLVLAGVSLRQWRRSHSQAAAWFTWMVLVLTALLGFGRLVQPDDMGTLVDAGRRGLLLLLGLFPYCLYRFTASLSERRPGRDRVALITTMVQAGGTLALPTLAPPPGAWPGVVNAYAVVVVVQWTLLSVLSVQALWSGGRRQPGVARRRMQLLAAAVVVLNLTLLMFVLSQGRHGPTAPPWQQATALASGILFLVGFAPPGVLRTVWRRHELEAFRRGEADLMSADSQAGVARIVLPHAVELVGAGGAVLVDEHRTVRGHRGVDEAGARAIADRIPDSGDRGPVIVRDLVAVPVGRGWLAVVTTPATPLFGPEEIALLGTLAHLAGLALERIELLDKERVSRQALAEREAQLADAQRTAQIGSFTWDPESGVVTWSDEMYRLLGFTPDAELDHLQAFAARVHPADRERVLEALANVAGETEAGSLEYRIVRPPDGVRWIHARLQPRSDDRGARFVGTVQDITDRKQAEAVLREAFEREQRLVAELRELARVKTDFISTISHDLRTPLTSIAGYVELLTDGTAGRLTRDQLDVLEVIDRNARRLTTLIEDLLTMSRIDAGGFTLTVAPVAVASLMDGVQRAVHPAARARGLTLTFDVAPNVGTLVVDAGQIDRVLLNLLTNAIKFTPPGGAVAVRVWRDRRDMMFCVADTGIGVPEEEQHQLFSPFFRSSTATDRAIPGTGLGLAIVKAIIDRHGGSITFHSQPGAGTTVIFVLPADTPVESQTPATTRPGVGDGGPASEYGPAA